MIEPLPTRWRATWVRPGSPDLHPLHDDVAKQLAEKLKSKRIVVWYDARREFAPFVGEVRGGARTSNGAVPVTVAGIATQLAEYDGSMFELHATVEPYVSGDAAEYVVIYVPGGERDRRGSVLIVGDVIVGDVVAFLAWLLRRARTSLGLRRLRGGGRERLRCGSCWVRPCRTLGILPQV